LIFNKGNFFCLKSNNNKPKKVNYFPIQKVKALYYKGFQLFGQQLGNKIANIKGKCRTKKRKNID